MIRPWFRQAAVPWKTTAHPDKSIWGESSLHQTRGAPVGDEADIDAVQCRAELPGHLPEAGDDGRELLQRSAAAQVFGVARDGFEPQDAFAFGITLQGSRSGP